MKLRTGLALTGIACSMLFFGSCKDDTDTPVDNNNGGSTTKTCKLIETKSDGETMTLTYSGDKLVKAVEEDTSETITYEYKYDNDGKLTEITEDGYYSYKMTYNSEGQITRIEEYDGMDYVGPYTLTYDSEGNLIKVEEFIRDNDMDVLFANYVYTYTNGELTKMTNLFDLNDDGVLDPADDIETSATVTSTDGKKNPLYGLPVYLTDFGNFQVFMKSNMTAGSIDIFGTTIPITATYTYNESGYPTKGTFNAGDDTVIEYSYMCE